MVRPFATDSGTLYCWIRTGYLTHCSESEHTPSEYLVQPTKHIEIYQFLQHYMSCVLITNLWHVIFWWKWLVRWSIQLQSDFRPNIRLTVCTNQLIIQQIAINKLKFYSRLIIVCNHANILTKTATNKAIIWDSQTGPLNSTSLATGWYDIQIITLRKAHAMWCQPPSGRLLSSCRFVVLILTKSITYKTVNIISSSKTVSKWLWAKTAPTHTQLQHTHTHTHTHTHV